MRNRSSVALFVVISACFLMAKAGMDATGNWTGELRGKEGRTARVRFALQREGDRISGTAGPVEKQNPGRIYDAKLEGNHLTFAVDDADEETGSTLTYHFDLTLSYDQMEGKAHGQSGDRSWTLAVSVTRDK